MKKILIVTYGGGHVNLMCPIAEECLKRTDISCTILALNTAIPYLLNTSLKFKTLCDYLGLFENENEIKQIGNEYAAQFHNHDAGFSYDESVAYYGLSMWDLITKVGKNQANDDFVKLGRRAFCPTLAMKKIIEFESPDIILISVPFRMEKAAVLVGNQKGICTCEIHDWYYYEQASPAKYHFVLNQMAKEDFVRNGIATDRIFVSGNPAFDQLLGKCKLSRDEFLANYKIPNNKKIVLWALTPSDCIIANTDKMLRDIILSNPDLFFIMKMHPGEQNVSFYEKVIEGANNAKLLHWADNRELLNHCDVLVSDFSTMILEASLLKKFILNTFRLLPNVKIIENDALSFEKVGLSVAVDNFSDLCHSFPNYLNSKEMHKMLFDSQTDFWIGVHKAAPAIVNQVLTL